MVSRSVRLFGVVLALALFSAHAALGADVLMKLKQHSDAFEVMGQKQPAKDVIQTVWMADDKISTSDEQQSMIMRLDKKVTYVINHTNKTYVEMPMDMSKMAGAMMPGAGEEEDAGVQNMMQNMMKMKITVTPTGKKKKINKWNCKQYIQKVESFMGPMTMDVWATEDLKMDQDVYLKYATGMFRQMPGMQSQIEQIQKEMKKIKGVAVLSTVDMEVMGQKMKSSTELLEFKRGKAPASAFVVPKGYKKSEMPGQPF